MAKSKKLDFAKVNSSRTDFFNPKAKKTFTHLQKVFTKTLILHYFDQKCYIWIQTDASGYTIKKMLSQLILEQSFSGYVIGEDPNFSKSSKIEQ